MSDLMNKKENSHNTPMRYGYRHDFNDLVNSFFGGLLDFPREMNRDLVNSTRQLSPKVEVEENVTENKVPTQLPKTGINIYIPISLVLGILLGMVIYYNKKKK